jgi:hypothetical protein
MYKKARLLFVWTLAYAAFAALFFHIAFNFQIWSAMDWHRLARATLRGFSGLTLGVSLAAALPIYLACAGYILKTGKSPINLMPEKKKSASKETAADKLAEVPKKHVLPPDLPDELKEAYIRFYTGILAKNAIWIDKKIEPKPEVADNSFIPMPASFDAPEPEEESAPVFRDFSFSSDSPVSIVEKDGKKIATYTFDDAAFWVADDPDHWFATGKQIESPIKLLLAADADERVLVLKEKNIMDLDKLAPEWEKLGIIVKN